MNNRQKNIVLLVSFVLSLFLVYHLAIKKTVIYKAMHTGLLKEKKTLNNAVEKKQFFQQKNKYLDSILKSKNISAHNSFQQTLLKNIGDFMSGEKIEIETFQKPHISLQNQTNVKTYSFTVKGDFNSLLKLIHHLEKQHLGELNSVNFEKKRNYKNRKDYLVLVIYLQRMRG